MDALDAARRKVLVAALNLATAELDDNVAGRLTADGSAQLDFAQEMFLEALAEVVALSPYAAAVQEAQRRNVSAGEELPPATALEFAFPWARHLPAGDWPLFERDLYSQFADVLGGGVRFAQLLQTVGEWRITAETLSDPQVAAALLGKDRPGDGGE